MINFQRTAVSITTYSFRSCIPGYHEYKDIWDVVVGEFLEDLKKFHPS